MLPCWHRVPDDDMHTQNKEGVKGRYWFMDADVRDGALTGKTGKTLLTILRHLGRLHEVLLLRASSRLACPSPF